MNVKNVSRGFGLIWILTSVLWAGLGVAGIVYGSKWLEKTQASLEKNLTLIIDSLESVNVLVDKTTDVVSSTHQSLATVQTSVQDASISLEDLRPLLGKTTNVVTIDIPNALEGVQDSMPTLIETARSVDQTLTWLSNFKFTIPNPFGSDWSYDLGISYNPEVPLDQSLETMNENLENVPEDLRDLDESLTSADDNLLTVSDDLAYLSDDIGTINTQLQEVVPRMETLAGNISVIKISIQETQAKLPESIEKAQKAMLAIMGLLIFTQIPSLFWGVVLVRGVLFPSESSEASE